MGIHCIAMPRLPITADAASVDRRFLLDGAYRPRGALSLAERSEYGLRTLTRQFKSFLNPDFSDPKKHGCGAVAVASVAHPRGREFVAGDRETVRTRCASGSKRLPAGYATKTTPVLSVKLVRYCSRAAASSGIPLRFQVRVQNGILTGIAHRGRLAAVRLLQEHGNGTYQSD